MTTFKVTRGQTPNYSRRRQKASGFMLHKTYGSFKSASGWLMDKRAGASADIVIGKDGEQFRLSKPDKQITWHAGVTNLNGHRFGKKKGIPMTPRITAWLKKVGHNNPNQSLIGVEFVSFGEPVTEAQVKSFWSYAKELNKAYGIPLPTEFNTFYHQESAYWKEKVDYKRVIAGGEEEEEKIEKIKEVSKGISLSEVKKIIKEEIKSQIKKIKIKYE